MLENLLTGLGDLTSNEEFQETELVNECGLFSILSQVLSKVEKLVESENAQDQKQTNDMFSLDAVFKNAEVI